MEKLHCGWLTKSPPEYKTRRLFLPAKWRKRYFVLYVPPSSGSLPGKSCPALMDYYSNEKMTCKRGSIDLERCHSIVKNFDSSYFKYIFIMKTIHQDRERDYYLASESEKEKNDWVNILCEILGLSKEPYNLRTTSEDVPLPVQTSPLIKPNTTSPPIKPNTTSPPIKPNTTSTPKKLNNYSFEPNLRTNSSDDYLQLEECIAGTQSTSPKRNGVDSRILIYQIPPRKKGDSENSYDPGSRDFHLNVKSPESVYNVPRSSRSSSEEYKMPKNWAKTSVSSNADGESEADFDAPIWELQSDAPGGRTLHAARSFNDGLRTSSSSSSSNGRYVNSDVYDIPPPKNHAMPVFHSYANATVDVREQKHGLPAVPLPIKTKSWNNTREFSNRLFSSPPPLDPYKRVTNILLPTKTSNRPSDQLNGLPSTSSSDEEDDSDEGEGQRNKIFNNNFHDNHDGLDDGMVYDQPRSEGRKVLHSVFEEFSFDEPSNQEKVKYLDLDFAVTPSADATPTKPPPPPPSSNKVEYREIDLLKTKALSELRVNRESSK